MTQSTYAMSGISLVLIITLPIIAFIIGVYHSKKTYTSSQDSLYKSEEQTNQALAVLNAQITSLNQKVEKMSLDTAKSQGQSDILMHSIHNNMQAMTSTLLDKKSRGAWGEFQLQQLLSDYLGNSPKIVEYQYKLINNSRVDAAIHMPDSYKILAIDSKFPLENYRLMMDAEANNAKNDYISARKEFIRNVKVHIDKISDSYARCEESIGDALMFVPSEAIYTEICSSEEDVLNYALSSNVILVSPTTLLGVVSTISRMTQEFEMQKNVDRTIEQIKCLSDEAERLLERAQKLESRQKQMDTEIHNVVVTASKLANKINEFQK